METQRIQLLDYSCSYDVTFLADWGDMAPWVQAVVTVVALCTTLWVSQRQVIAQRVHESTEKLKAEHLHRIQNILKGIVFLGGLQRTLAEAIQILQASDISDAKLRVALRLPISVLESNLEKVRAVMLRDFPNPKVIIEISKAEESAAYALEALSAAVDTGNINRDVEIFKRARERVVTIQNAIFEFHQAYVMDPDCHWPQDQAEPEEAEVTGTKEG